MVSCSNCSKELPEDASYCSSCGNYVGKSFIEEFEVKSDELVQKTKEIINEGNVNKIIVEDENGKILLEVPVTAGVVGIILAPWIAALGAITAIATQCKIRVERRE